MPASSSFCGEKTIPSVTVHYPLFWMSWGKPQLVLCFNHSQKTRKEHVML